MLSPGPSAAYSSSNEWTLVDVEVRHRAYPRSFFIDSRADRESLQPGDSAYLIFELADTTGYEFGGERLWIQVTAVHPDHYVGRVDNEPDVLRSVAYEDTLVFGPEHIAQISRADDEPEDPFTWMQVGVRAKAIDDDIRPRRIYREIPWDEKDSGWRILIGDETDDTWTDEDAIRWPSVGWLSDLWPEVVDVFRQDPRFEDPERELTQNETIEFTWDEGSRKYVKA